MYIAAFFLFILNILLLVFFYFRLKKRFSDEASISHIRKEASKLIGDIAFQTDCSVTIMEEKFAEANKLLAQIDSRILIAKQEVEKRDRTERVLKDLGIAQAESFEGGLTEGLTGVALENADITKSEEENPAEDGGVFREARNGGTGEEAEPIKIYTKQLLLQKGGGNYQNENAFYEQIIEMAKKGLSIELIAEKVPLSAGEIELIVSLNT